MVTNLMAIPILQQPMSHSARPSDNEPARREFPAGSGMARTVVTAPAVG